MVWMMFHSHRSLGCHRFVVKILGAALLLLALYLPGFVRRESKAAVSVLTDALSGLSGRDLKKYNLSSGAAQRPDAG